MVGRGKSKRTDRFYTPNKPPPKDPSVNKGVVDTASTLIDKIPFDHHTGNYKELIDKLRTYILSFDPQTAVSIMAHYLRVDISVNKSDKRRLKVIIRKLDSYLLAFDNQLLYEFSDEKDVPKPVRIFFG